MIHSSVLKKIAYFFLLLSFADPSKFIFASYEKDPVKDTQSNVVAVTEELLTREGELQPASPTFKMLDTAHFLVKKPYQKPEIKQANQPSEKSSSSSNWEDEWFFWEGNTEDSDTEPIDVK
ncbi:MAG: hypothetical protein A3C35_00100 [Omnitrophica bacterium RIFCSPHIGHO2_02_FULL_46_11]|nr:MAG: hypothetical protein A3C35_00100 [Omnitrophica bacterium RIFCSPHIGHO2_02_FULL_46_11]OGW87561.1 MAG: hypothetical protein A3A81_03325 [Omnitrophica bacterium RIFCSPLOWO2_01_FULL_45_10b]